jgi:periplasmic divalent cation tolerance protein
MAEETECCVVLVTASSRQEGETIAQSLIETRLAACVTLLPVQSIYRWQGTIYKNEEWQLLIKSDRGQFAALEAKVRQLHSYEVPEIIALPIVVGSDPYLQWILEQVNGDS